MLNLLISFSVILLIVILAYLIHELTHFVVHYCNHEAYLGLTITPYGIGTKFQAQTNSKSWMIILGPLSEIPIYLLSYLLLPTIMHFKAPFLLILLLSSLTINLIPLKGNDGAHFLTYWRSKKINFKEQSILS